MTFPAIDGNDLGSMAGVNVDPATIPFLIGSVKWLSNLDLWEGDSEDIYETTQAFEQLIRRLSELTDTPNAPEFVMIPSGTITEYIGTDAPTGWLKCNGAQYNQADYPDLTAVLPAALKSGIVFNTPDMRGRMPVGVDAGFVPLFQLASTGGETEHELTVSELPSHNHVQDPHTHLQAAHNHLQDPHTHLQAAHNHLQDPHTHLQAAHNHNISQRGSALAAGSGFAMGANETGSVYSVGSGNATATNNNTTAVNQSATATNNNATAVNQSATATNNNATAVNQSTGDNLAHNNMPPYFAVNYIIKT